jgi:hypothetical protein
MVVSASVGTPGPYRGLKDDRTRADHNAMVIVMRLTLALTACLAAMGVLMFSHSA